MKPVRLRLNLKYLLIAAAAVLLLANRGFRMLVSNYREYRHLQQEKSMLEAQGAELRAQLGTINSKPAIEQAARKELSMIRPGETEYRFPPPKESDR
jgi:cell division protein FtsB